MRRVWKAAMHPRGKGGRFKKLPAYRAEGMAGRTHARRISMAHALTSMYAEPGKRTKVQRWYPAINFATGKEYQIHERYGRGVLGRRRDPRGGIQTYAKKVAGWRRAGKRRMPPGYAVSVSKKRGR